MYGMMPQGPWRTEDAQTFCSRQDLYPPLRPQEASQRASEKSGSLWSWEGPLGTPLAGTTGQTLPCPQGACRLVRNILIDLEGPEE